MNDAVRAAIGQVVDPQLGRTLEELDAVRAVTVDNGRAVAAISVADPDYPYGDRLTAAVEEAGRSVAGIDDVMVQQSVLSDEEADALMARLRPEKKAAGGPGSRTRVITITSGKGGVGKSSVTVNLAVALAARGHSVGVIDADVYGFSIPRMLGVLTPPAVVGGSLIAPQAYGVRVMSMDYFVQPDQAVIWRGPLLHKALEQFLTDVFWDEPDYLLIDTPPGTGDVAISLSQFLPRAEVLVVTTPQATAQRVAKKAALMAEKVNQTVIGVVENMAWFTGDDGTRYPLFGSGGGEQLARELGVPLMGRIPLVPAMRAGADEGIPVAVAAPGSDADVAFDEFTDTLEKTRPRVRTHPELVIK
ncbi:MAG: Mrp/NBP35 family ATP-binding protein [Actinobacteria bacterium]|nr:Mrp/NBP35 family ATP-binding protein [Actinomycetota bacterium]